MKRIGFLLGVMMLCTFIGLAANHKSASAINVAKVRQQCSTYAKAKKHMTRITFKVWDIKGNKKVTKTKSILVNKLVAKKFKKAFDAIYRSKEKFPIHDVGGFDWRGSNKSLHSLGLAVDINANENYMIDGRKVIAGSLWKPGKNPYSIPKKGSVVKCMKKHGFKQCLWGKRRDYMHFSVKGL